MASVLRMSVTQKLMHGLVLPFPTPQGYELAISRMKTGGDEFIMASCILLASPVLSGPLLSEHWHWLPYTPLIPLHQTFHPWSNRDALKKFWWVAQSFLFTQPRGVSTVCCWACSRQFTIHGVSSVSLLSGVCCPRVVVVKQTHLACMTIHRRSPLQEQWEKVSLVEDSWASHFLVLHEVQRDSFSNLVFHFIWLLLPSVLHLPLPPVGISFSQDQVTSLQWNGISLPVIISLLSLRLRCGLHLCFLEGFSESFT